MAQPLRRAAAVHALTNAGCSSAALFLPLLAVQLGAGEAQVGLIGAAFGASVFVSAWLSGALADAGRRRWLIRAGALASALTAPLHLLATDPLSLMLIRGTYGLAAGLYPAALAAYAYDADRRPGRFGGWGAMGFGLGTLAAGVLGGFPLVFAFSGLCMASAFAVALTLEPRPEVRVKVNWFPRAVVRNNLPVYVAMLMRHTGAAAVWIVFPLYLLQIGASPFWIGVVFFLNTGSQVIFMGALDHQPATRLVVAGLGASAAVFVLFWLAPSFWFILPVQLLLAASWALLYVGTLTWGMERNAERATSTGMLHSVMGLGNVLGPVLGGLAAATWGLQAPMLLAAGLCLAGIPVFLSFALRLAPAGAAPGAPAGPGPVAVDAAAPVGVHADANATNP